MAVIGGSLQKVSPTLFRPQSVAPRGFEVAPAGHSPCKMNRPPILSTLAFSAPGGPAAEPPTDRTVLTGAQPTGPRLLLAGRLPDGSHSPLSGRII